MDIEYDDYIFTYYYMSDRLGNCRLSLIEIDNLPMLLIKPVQKSTITIINMISGKFYKGDPLTNTEYLCLYNFMNQSPNFHDKIHNDEGDCNNWTFMIIQYISEITPRTNEIDNILSNIRKYGNKIIIPEFYLCNYTDEISIKDFILNINNLMEG